MYKENFFYEERVLIEYFENSMIKPARAYKRLSRLKQILSGKLQKEFRQKHFRK